LEGRGLETPFYPSGILCFSKLWKVGESPFFGALLGKKVREAENNSGNCMLDCPYYYLHGTSPWRGGE